MISSRPICPDAKKFAAGAELSLNDKSVIFLDGYINEFLETTGPMSANMTNAC